jgi:pilus assembly protein CpaC
MSICNNRFSKRTYRALVLAACATTLSCGSAQSRPSAGTQVYVTAKWTERALGSRIAEQSGNATQPSESRTLTSRPEFANHQLHLLIGRSIFIKSDTRLRRVYVSNPAVVDSFTSSRSQIVVTAKSPGVSSLILWDETGQSQTYVVSADLDVESLQKSIREAFPYDNIRVEAQQDRVSLFGTVSSDASSAVASKIAGLYAKNVANSLLVKQSHTPQVKLKVQIVEIDRSKLDAFGVNFFSQGKNTSAVSTGQFPSVSTATSQSSGSGPNSPTLSVSDPLNLLFYNSGLNVGLTLKDMQDKQILQILAEPTITTLSGQKASFLSGGEFPFPVVQGASTGFPSVTVQFRPFGVKLEFTPDVNADGTIQLKVAPEVSALDFTNAVSISGFTIPAIATRRAETQVELRDGQSFAISGLLDHRTTEILSKMPGIAEVPILGQLFRSKNINRSVVELVVIVTPSVVDPLTDSTSPVLPKFPLPMLDPTQFDKKISKQTPVSPSTTQPQPGTGDRP